MAIGTGNLPYPGKVYNPFDILTAEELNEDVANIESLADGSGIGDAAIPELKTVIKSSYSTSEVNTGAKWVDGKDIYKKTVSIGTLPDTTSKTVAHGIAGVDIFTDIRGNAKFDTGSQFPLPFASPTLASQIQVFANSTSVQVSTGSDRSNGTGYVTLRYTKT